MRLYPTENLGIVVMANTTQPYDVDALFEIVRHAVNRQSPGDSTSSSGPSSWRWR